MKEKVLLIGIVLLVTGTCKVHAQQLISAAGGFTESASASLSWSVGETAISTLQSGNYILTQGFQQNFASETGIPYSVSQDFLMEVYPNPVRNTLNIRFNKILKDNSLVEVRNIAGSLIIQKTITSSEISIIEPVDELSMGVYQINLYSEEGMLIQKLKFVKL